MAVGFSEYNLCFLGIKNIWAGSILRERATHSIHVAFVNSRIIDATQQFQRAWMYFSIAARPSGKLLFHMLAYQIFQTIPADLAETIFTYFRKEDRDTYKGAIERLAEQQKMRAVFITKQSPEKQVKLLTSACGRKQAESIAMHLLEQWLMGDRKAILIDFMDRMKIAHDGAGMAEKLPDTMDQAMVRSAVEEMLKTHPSREVAVYLNVFQEQKEGGWPEQSALRDADPWLTA